MLRFCDQVQLVRARVWQDLIEILAQMLADRKADAVRQRRGDQADGKRPPHPIHHARRDIHDHAGNDDRPDLHHLQQGHAQDARERHIALQIRLQRLFVAGLQERDDIWHRLPHNGIDKQQREQHKNGHDRAADQFCFLHARVPVISISV